jgi:hypothetical protein
MNIPKTPLDSASNILLVGIGGGFDVFTGLPFVYHWKNKNFVLANSSPSDLMHFRQSTPNDYPEGLLSKEDNIKATYTVGRHGCKAVSQAYSKIIETHNIDCVLAIDGGVDSLAIGDEQDNGTILEDFVGLAALSDIKVNKILCCAGFGTETEENMNHFRVLENMAKLASSNSFLGSFSLTKQMPEFSQYVNECESVWAEGRRKSHIQTKIISAANGRFNSDNQYSDVDPRLSESTGICFISLLSSIYWMFDLDGVVAQNKAIKNIKKSNTFVDAKLLLKDFLKSETNLRSHDPLPL